MAYAYKLLTVRSYSEADLRRRLSRKFSAQAAAMEITKGEKTGALPIEETINRLKEDRLLDDNRLAHDIVRRCLTGRAVGRSKIQLELKKRLIPPLLIATVLKENPCDEIERALICLKQKWRCLERLPDQAAKKKKIASLLAYRGFSAATIIDLLQNYHRLARMTAE